MIFFSTRISILGKKTPHILEEKTDKKIGQFLVWKFSVELRKQELKRNLQMHSWAEMSQLHTITLRSGEIRILITNFYKHSILFTDFTDKNNVPNRNINSEEDIIGK